MAVNALAGRTAFFAIPLSILVATPAEIVKLILDHGVHRRVCLVTVETQSLARMVDEVVVTVDAVD
jgi:hypothetical protein